MKLIQQLDENTKGRDFIIGDLHGSLQKLYQAMENENFDPNIDRIISVGDLIDRGRNSLESLQLILEPWFYGVRGNHEDMLLAYFKYPENNSQNPGEFLNNGGTWIYDIQYDDEAMSTLLYCMDKLMEYPAIIKVNGQNEYFVTHAERRIFSDDELNEVYQNDNNARADEREYLNWSRDLINEGLELCDPDWLKQQIKDENNPFILIEPTKSEHMTLTYVGHTILPKPVIYKSHAFIDTGAYLDINGKLTFINNAEFQQQLRNIIGM